MGLWCRWWQGRPRERSRTWFVGYVCGGKNFLFLAWTLALAWSGGPLVDCCSIKSIEAAVLGAAYPDTYIFAVHRTSALEMHVKL